MLDYIGASIGEKVTLPLDFSAMMGDQALVKLFSLMVLEIDTVKIDYTTREVHLAGDSENSGRVPLDALGLTSEAYKIDLEYRVAQTYSEPNGKFNLFFGNAAIMECNWVFPELIDAVTVKAEEFAQVDPELFAQAMKIINEVETWITEKGVTFCHFSVTIEGVLVD